jgi:hypothetical protein
MNFIELYIKPTEQKKHLHILLHKVIQYTNRVFNPVTICLHQSYQEQTAIIAKRIRTVGDICLTESANITTIRDQDRNPNP